MTDKPKSLEMSYLKELISELQHAKTLAADRKVSEAVAIVRKKWETFPEPKLGWDFSDQFLKFNAQFFRDLGQYEEAHHWADHLLSHATYLSGPEIVKGSIYLAAGEMAPAREYFQKAFDRHGRRAFQGEDPKYLAFLKGKEAANPLSFEELGERGDDLFQEKNWKEAIGYFQEAMSREEGLDNPFVQLRLGQCWFELGDLGKAGEPLAKAYMFGGREMFEEDDPKYWQLVTTLLKPPAGGW